MAKDFDLILDECIDRLSRGESLEACLSDYPDDAERLRLLLRSMSQIQATYAFTPSLEAKRLSRQKFLAAVEKRQSKTGILAFLKGVSRPVVWTTVAVTVLVITGVFGLRYITTPPALVSSSEGNFAFLISDEPNDIGDFTSMNVTISKVGLQSSNSQDWLEFDPEIKMVDLVQLQGEQSKEIWRGNVPIGDYSQVLIYVSRVIGKLKSTGQEIEIKLPSNKLSISSPFTMTDNSVTHFTFDITVISVGNKGKYILKPQISESGTQQLPKSTPQITADKVKGKI